MRSALRNFTRVISGALLGWVLLTSSGSAVTLLDTINGAPYSPSAGWTIDPGGGSSGVAIPFTAGGATTITDITAYIWSFGPSSSVTIGIMADAGGPSGSFLNSQAVVPSLAAPVVLSSLSWLVGPGTYWLAAIGVESAWEINYALPQQSMSFSFGGSWFLSPDYPAMAEIIGQTAVPLPAALPLLASGLGALGLLGWRRRRKIAAAA